MRFILLLILLFAGYIQAQKKPFTLEEVIPGSGQTLVPENMRGLIWKDAGAYTSLENDTLWLTQAKNGNSSVLLTLQQLNRMAEQAGYAKYHRFPTFSFLNENELLVSQNNTWTVFGISQMKAFYQIQLPDDAENAVFCKERKYVAYTLKDNLYLAFSDGKNRQVTSNGGDGMVNGSSVHRNEFGINGGIFISPAGNLVAFYSKDESMVTQYPVVNFLAREAELAPVRYPMAGLRSEEVNVGIYHVDSQKVIFLKTGGPADHYLTNVSWSSDENELLIAELNREQNHLKMNSYDPLSGNLTGTLWEEKHEAYVEPLHPVWFSGKNPGIVYELSRKDGWFHLWSHNRDEKQSRQITRGEWEITSFLGFGEKEKYAFVEATYESPLENHIYRVEISTGKMTRLTGAKGVHSGTLSPGGHFILDKWSSPEVPLAYNIISAEGGLDRNIFTSPDPFEGYVSCENRLVDIPSADGRYTLTGRLILPPDFDPSKKYPVIVYVYGGPHSQLVKKNWQNGARGWQYFMASKGYIAFTMDNRGTINRGREFETVIHRQLGIQETEDQMKGVEYLKKLPFVDENRIGVHGWSYGGFMTLNLMLRHPEVFRVGVAGGPVVNWSMYEVMYGERYMDTPSENPEGYAETNMSNHARNLRGKLLLIHGAMDETVVMQHSMKFLRACVEQYTFPDFFVYPAHPHNVSGKDRVHLMQKVSDYFFDHL